MRVREPFGNMPLGETVEPTEKNQPHFLVVEDEESTARLIKTLLERDFNAIVELASDARTASDEISSESFDIVTLDFELPDRDGLDLLEEIKAMENPPPVIMVTGRGDERVAASSLRLGASSYIVKDDRLVPMLVEAVEKALADTHLKRLSESFENGGTGYRRIVETALEGVWVIDADSQTAYANESFAEMLGYSANELTGKRFGDFVLPEDRSVVEDQLARRRRGIKERREFRLMRKSGEDLWASISMSSIFDGSGEYSGAILLVTDFTARKQAEELFYNAFHSSPLLMAITRLSDGFFLEANKEFLDTFGLARDELVGRTYADMGIWKRHEDLMALEETVRAEGRARGFETAMVTRDGEDRWFLHYAEPMQRRGESCLLLTLQDITDDKAADDAVYTAMQYHEALFNSVADGICVTDMVGNIVDCNRASERSLDYDKSELLCMNVTDLVVYQGKRSDMLSDMLSELRDHGFAAAETTLKRSDGSSFPAVTTVSLLKKPGGAEMGVVLVARDVTDDRRAMAMLKQERDFISTLLDTVDAMVAVFDVEGVVIRANPAFAAGLGYSTDEVRGRQYTEFLSHEDEPHIVALYKIPDELVFPVKGEVKAVMRSGDLKSVTCSVSVVRNAEGQIKHFIMTGLDTSGINAAQEALSKANRELNAYADAVSHDLKNPLSAIKMGLDLIAEAVSESDGRLGGLDANELLGVLGRNAVKAQGLVEDLRVLADSGQIPKEVDRVDVSEVVRGILDEYSSLINEKRIDVRVEGDLKSVVADEVHVYQVFSNIISNALVHNVSDEPLVEISYLGREPDGARRWRVRDNGRRLPVEVIAAMEDPLTRRLGGGKGLGLTIVSKVLEVYGGGFTAYDSDGPCFEFTFHDYGL